MPTFLEDSLGRMLDTYDARRNADLARAQKSKDESEQFLARFAELRRGVVRPVFEQAGAMLTARGHAFTITEEEFGADAEGRSREARISLSIAPAGMAPPPPASVHERSLSIVTRHYNKTVWINAGRSLDPGGIAGAKGAYPIERIDQQLIEEEVLKLVTAVMGG